MTWTYTLIALSILAAGLTGYYIGWQDGQRHIMRLLKEIVLNTQQQEATKEDGVTKDPRPSTRPRITRNY